MKSPGIKVLVIENDPSVRFALGRISLGSEVTMEFIEPGEWANAKAGFVAAIADDSMLVGMEEKLPLTLMKERLGCPVIVMTALGKTRIKSIARDAGAASVLYKPFSAAELRKQLAKAIAGLDNLVPTVVSETENLRGAPASPYQASDLGGQIAGDQVFDELFVELERRQPLDESLDAFDVVERHLVKRALLSCSGNQSHAARFLGITRNTLRKRIHKYGFVSLLSTEDLSPVEGNK